MASFRMSGKSVHFAMPLFAFLVAMMFGQAAPSGYTEKMFRAALDNQSTAPNYVLVMIVAQEKGHASPRLICTTANFLEGAIHQEYGLAYDEAGVQKTRNILLAKTDRTFVLTKPPAIKNVPCYYTEDQLSEVREILRSKTNDELTHEFDPGELRRKLTYSHVMDKKADKAYRDAIAHVLLERGILCGMGCVSDATYISH